MHLDKFVTNDGQQIEPDLAGGVLLNALLDHLSGEGQPSLITALAEGDRALLKAVKLVQLAVDGHIGNEMESVFTFARACIRLFNNEGVIAREFVVRRANLVTVADGVASVFIGQAHRE